MDYNKQNSDTRVIPQIKSPRDMQKRKAVETVEVSETEFMQMQEKIAQLEKELADKEVLIESSKFTTATNKATKTSK